MDRRYQLERWAARQLNIPQLEDGLSAISDDASFRRYFRSAGQPYVFVDAPPDKEDSRPFVEVSELLLSAGINAPRVKAVDLELGFMMLTDLGDTLYLDDTRDASRIPALYSDAIAALNKMHTIDADLPPYDEKLLRDEMQLFVDWFLEKQLQLDLTPEETSLVEAVFDVMVDSAMQQPQVFVHRDYHCRNLMVTSDNNPGVLDFQDAVFGPVTYDLVSLFKDCYFQFERSEVVAWVETFRDGMRPQTVDAQSFLKWFDFMGLQRHLKCAGIFSRLNLRDSKPRYLDDIPLVLSYISEVTKLYPELESFGAWFDLKVLRASIR